MFASTVEKLCAISFIETFLVAFSPLPSKFKKKNEENNKPLTEESSNTLFLCVFKKRMWMFNLVKLIAPHHEKTCFMPRRTTKVQISLRICAV